MVGGPASDTLPRFVEACAAGSAREDEGSRHHRQSYVMECTKLTHTPLTTNVGSRQKTKSPNSIKLLELWNFDLHGGVLR